MLAHWLLLRHNDVMIERIGIIGGGQLGRMMTVPAKQLGFEVTVLEANPGCPAAQVGADQIVGSITDEAAIRELADQTDVLTWEIEHIPAELLLQLKAEGYNVSPDPWALLNIQDKLVQKQNLVLLGIPVAEHVELEDVELGQRLMYKSRRGGYDGRGNLVTDDPEEAAERFGGSSGQDSYFAEKLVPFRAEVAAIFARDRMGNVGHYPLVETVHVDNICHTVMMPPRRTSCVAEARANAVGREVMEMLPGAGVFAIEMFVLEGDEIVVNEIAPRVHNSGHLTMEANETSQFEQHVRAITGMPLGDMDPRHPDAMMINILGTRVDDVLDRTGLDAGLALGDVSVHFYGKTPRPERKIGHITVVGENAPEVTEKAQQARRALTNL